MTKIIIVYCCVICLHSCVTSKKLNYIQSGKNIPEYADSIAYSDYRLQKGDLLHIMISTANEDERVLFNGKTIQQTSKNTLYDYQIYEDGTIDFPLIGKIEVIDKTVREVKFILDDILKKTSTNASASVRLINRTFSVIGEAGSGRFEMPKEKINIFQAIAMVGDLSTFSDRKNIQIIRQTNESTQVYNFDIRSKSIINSEFYYIQPNDVIYIPFIREKSFGVTHLSGALNVTLTTVSFLMTLVNIGFLIKNGIAK